MDEILADSVYVQHVLNEKNKYISASYIERILKKYGLEHKVKNINNFQLSMIHKSYLKDIQLNEKTIKLMKDIPPIDKKYKSSVIPLQENSYESLEFLGDAVIHLILASYLFNRYENKDPGFLTILRTKIEKGETLNKLSRVLGFHEFAIFARNIELAGGRVNNVNIMEDIFEAFMGALSLETSFENCKLFLTNVIDSNIDFAQLINTEDNYKEMLMQHYHKLGFKTTPRYELIEIIDEKPKKKDEKPKKKFVMGAYDPDKKLIGKGTAHSKVAAAQIAAQNALIKFNVIKENVDNSDDDDEIYEIN
jgi:dsRNA-specific ribonuclease